jgi:hypothetical protein
MYDKAFENISGSKKWYIDDARKKYILFVPCGGEKYSFCSPDPQIQDWCDGVKTKKVKKNAFRFVANAYLESQKSTPGKEQAAQSQATKTTAPQESHKIDISTLPQDMQENPVGVLTEFAQANNMAPFQFFKIGDHGTGIDLGGGVAYRVSGDKPGDTAKKTKREVAYLACKEFLVHNSIKQGRIYKFTPKTPEGEKVKVSRVQRGIDWRLGVDTAFDCLEGTQTSQEPEYTIHEDYPSKVAKQFPGDSMGILKTFCEKNHLTLEIGSCSYQGVSVGIEELGLYSGADCPSQADSARAAAAWYLDEVMSSRIRLSNKGQYVVRQDTKEGQDLQKIINERTREYQNNLEKKRLEHEKYLKEEKIKRAREAEAKRAAAQRRKEHAGKRINQEFSFEQKHELYEKYKKSDACDMINSMTPLSYVIMHNTLETDTPWTPEEAEENLKKVVSSSGFSMCAPANTNAFRKYFEYCQDYYDIDHSDELALWQKAFELTGEKVSDMYSENGFDYEQALSWHDNDPLNGRYNCASEYYILDKDPEHQKWVEMLETAGCKVYLYSQGDENHNFQDLLGNQTSEMAPVAALKIASAKYNDPEEMIEEFEEVRSRSYYDKNHEDMDTMSPSLIYRDDMKPVVEQVQAILQKRIAEHDYEPEKTAEEEVPVEMDVLSKTEPETTTIPVKTVSAKTEENAEPSLDMLQALKQRFSGLGK